LFSQSGGYSIKYFEMRKPFFSIFDFILIKNLKQLIIKGFLFFENSYFYCSYSNGLSFSQKT
tara:strand:- start:20527 stop:20712 length:186 start_codon:yes stop_codon:yes gene_type:complete